MSEILAFDPKRRTSAQAIADLASLDYLKPNDFVLDATYGKGRFWRKWRPDTLWTNDFDYESHAQFRLDYCHLPAMWTDKFDVVVFDPPFKLNGTGGSHASDKAYGVDNPYRSIDERLRGHHIGIAECVRVAKTGGLVLYKTQDQVCGGKKMWLSAMRVGGARLVDQIYIVGYRKQPAGRPQRHVRSNASVIQIYRKAK